MSNRQMYLHFRITVLQRSFWNMSYPKTDSRVYIWKDSICTIVFYQVAWEAMMTQCLFCGKNFRFKE